MATTRRRRRRARAKPEFSKGLLAVDYAIFALLLKKFFEYCEAGIDVTNLAIVLGAWAVQLGVSQAAYYWKAKNENRIKIPIKVIETLPDDIRQELDLTQVVTSIIQSD